MTTHPRRHAAPHARALAALLTTPAATAAMTLTVAGCGIVHASTNHASTNAASSAGTTGRTSSHPSSRSTRHPSPSSSASGSPAPLPPVYTATVAAVADGDTITVVPTDRTTRIKVRLLGIDAPEVAHGSPAQCGGAVAKNALDSLIWHQQVTVALDPAADATDRYGRTLAYVGYPAGGVSDVQLWLLQHGLAEAWHPKTSTTPTRYDTYLAAEKTARAAKAGGWALCQTQGRPQG